MEKEDVLDLASAMEALYWVGLGTGVVFGFFAAVVLYWFVKWAYK